MLPPFNQILSSVRDIGVGGYETLLKKPLFLLGMQGQKVRGLFTGLPDRQRAIIYPGLLWVVPLVMVWPYQSVYMVKLGLSKTEIGVYQSLMNAVCLICVILGGYLSDSWGRKKTLILFDILSWMGYCLCMALASNKWWCVAAIFFLATNAGSATPYLSLLAEGVTAKGRAVVFTILQMVNICPSLLFFPLLGVFWVDTAGAGTDGFLKANHQMYWLLTVLVALGIVLRWKYLPASETFEKPPETWFHTFGDVFRQYRDILKKFFQKPASGYFIASKFLDEWIIFVWGTYSTLYFVNQMGLKDSFLGVLTQVAPFFPFLFLFIILPNLTEKHLLKILGLDQLFGFGALAVLLLLSSNTESALPVCIFSACLGSIGLALYSSLSTAVWMSIMEEKERAKAVSATLAVIRVGLFAFGSIGGLLYGKVSPAALLGVMIAIRVLNFVLLRRVSRTLSATVSSGGD
jgi:MFS transporter, DHA1 family, tetracycline resistance protein